MLASDAKLKCSNCGAELSNLTFGLGKKGSAEHFRQTIANPDGKALDDSSKVVLKVVDADMDRF